MINYIQTYTTLSPLKSNFSAEATIKNLVKNKGTI